MQSKLIIYDQIIPTLVACSEEEKAQGLQGYDWPPPVMSFPCDKPQVCKFWMHNTPSPLDIIFVRDGQVCSLHSGIPFSQDRIGPNFPVDLVVEMPFGTAESLKIALHTPIQIRYSVADLGRWTAAKLAKLL